MGIESQFIRKAVKSPRSYYGIRIRKGDALLFWCREPRGQLRGTGALKYINWGETRGFDEVPSCRGREEWYFLAGPTKPILLWPSAFFERHIVYECPRGHVADKVFYTVSGEVSTFSKAWLNSSIVSLFVEVEGYQLNHGGIFVTTEWLSRVPMPVRENSRISEPYESVASRNVLLCQDELKQSDRNQLDREALASIGLKGNDAVDDLHEAIVDFVAARIGKARRTLTKKGRQQREQAVDETRGIWSDLPEEEEEA